MPLPPACLYPGTLTESGAATGVRETSSQSVVLPEKNHSLCDFMHDVPERGPKRENRPRVSRPAGSALRDMRPRLPFLTEPSKALSTKCGDLASKVRQTTASMPESESFFTCTAPCCQDGAKFSWENQCLSPAWAPFPEAAGVPGGPPSRDVLPAPVACGTRGNNLQLGPNLILKCCLKIS